MELPEESKYRFIVLLNKKISVGVLMNALGHMTAGLAGGSGKASEMCFLQYKDKDGGVHPNISHFPSPEIELEYYDACMFGLTDVLREFTKKFSLFR